MSDAADLAKAVHYGELAARRATEAFAFGEAARQLERALQVDELADADDVRSRCDLLLALGEVLGLAGEAERALRQIAPEALPIAEELGDRSRSTSRACRIAVGNLDALEVYPHKHGGSKLKEVLMKSLVQAWLATVVAARDILHYVE